MSYLENIVKKQKEDRDRDIRLYGKKKVEEWEKTDGLDYVAKKLFK
jgi:hypothetical protein